MNPFRHWMIFWKRKLELELSDLLEEFSGSTLFVSHSREEIYRLCDRVCVMEQGKSSPVIPIKQLFETPVSRAAAVLSGCKNYSRACPAGEGRVYAQDWGVTLEYEGDAPEPFHYIGVRSHYIYPVLSKDAAGKKNTFCCEIMRVVEDVFSIVILLQPKGAEGLEAEEENRKIRVEMTKEAWKEFCRREGTQKEMWIWIEGRDIMVLA